MLFNFLLSFWDRAPWKVKTDMYSLYYFGIFLNVKYLFSKCMESVLTIKIKYARYSNSVHYYKPFNLNQFVNLSHTTIFLNEK